MFETTSAGAGAATYRDTRFHYVRVTRRLIVDLSDKLEAGRSVVLLGPRRVGKQIAVAEVRRRLLKQQPGSRFIRLRLERDRVASASALHQLLVTQLRDVLSEAEWPNEGSLEDLGRLLCDLLRREPVPLVAFVSNIDFLPDALSRQLLKIFRELTDLEASSMGRMTVLLTGATDLAPLVHGADSEFSVPDQYVIMGFGQRAFSRQVTRLERATGMTIEPDAVRFLHQQTGGNLHLLALLINAVVDHRCGHDAHASQVVTHRELRQIVWMIGSDLSVFRDVVMYWFSRLESSPATLLGLQDLLLRLVSRRPGCLGDRSHPTDRIGAFRNCRPPKRALGLVLTAASENGS